MPSASSDTISRDRAAERRPSRSWFHYVLAALFVLLAAFCVEQAMRTRRQIVKYTTPPPGIDSVEEPSQYQFVEEDFVEPYDPRPATEQLTDRVQAIADGIAQLNSANQANQAGDMQAQLDRILAQREGPYPLDGAPQLHAIGMYCGGDPWVPVEGLRARGRSTARIKITHRSAPLTLAFCAYFPVHWILEVEPDVQIERVILGGHYQQLIEGLPSGVAIEGQVHANPDPVYEFFAETTLQGLPVADRLQELTGHWPTTFQITRQFGGTPMVIGPGGDEWTAAMTMHALGPLYQEAVREGRTNLARQLVNHTFTDVSCKVVQRGDVAETSLAQHSIFGPYADSMQPLERGTPQLAIDPRGPTLFGFRENQGLAVYEPQSGIARPWPVKSVEFRAHRDTYLAFDTKRNRLLAWDMDLLAIDPDKQEAVVLRKGNPFVRGLAYSPDEDLLYACCASSERESVCNQVTIIDLCTFNDRGEELSRTKLGVPIPGGDWNDTTPAIKMRVVGNKLLVMSLGGSGCSDDPYVAFDTNHVIDPKTGKLLFACRRKPR
ncbi:MAG: hypothetical protein L0211_25665 [Planctomycetaceae bacterium]|nr:hypothetical protein [Planctomycetaceae bacterium]